MEYDRSIDPQFQKALEVIREKTNQEGQDGFNNLQLKSINIDIINKNSMPEFSLKVTPKIVMNIVQVIVGKKLYFDVDILALTTFIAVMYIIEALLIMIDGGRGAIPVFKKKDNFLPTIT